MPRSSWGSIREKSRGAWELRYNVNGKRTSTIVRGTKREAELELARIRLQQEHSGDGSETLDDFFFGVFVPECEQRVADGTMSPRTLKGYREVYRANIQPEFGKKRMNQIKGADVQAWLSNMTKGQAEHSKAVLKLVMRRAEDLEYIEHHPMNRRYIMPTTLVKARDKSVYSEAELLEIAEEAKGEIWEAAFLTASFGGGQLSEVVGLRPDEASFDDTPYGLFAILPVMRSINYENRQVQIIPRVKNEFRAAALIVMEPASLRIRELARLARENGEEWFCDDGFGNPVDPDVITRAYKAWLGRSKHQYIPFGNLRNAYSTMLHAHKIDHGMVSELMRHSTLNTDHVFYNRPDISIFESILGDAFKET